MFDRCNMDRFEISLLRNYYGALLTQRQNDMLVMHYDEDLSFGEIASICGISRQAVLDGINKGEKHLAEFEEKLHWVEKDKRINSLLDDLTLAIGKDETKQAACVAEIKRILVE